MSSPSTALPEIKPDYPELWGHPRPLWMLFMAEFWERFAFYGMRWALTLYIVTQFFDGDASGQSYASKTYGAYLALVYASAIFGGYIADRVVGYQRSILTGALFMAAGLFIVMIPNQQLFLVGLATIIVGNGLFKPNISSLVGKLYAADDSRRDRGFTIFYMGINCGGFVAPLLTGWLASVITDTPMQQNYKVVFATTAIGMLMSYLWFWFGRRHLQGVGAPPPDRNAKKMMSFVIVGAALAIIPVYCLMSFVGAIGIAWVLGVIFVGLAVILLVNTRHEGKVAQDRVKVMLIMFMFNVLFFMFFEQAGSSFTFLAQNIVDRQLFAGFVFPTGWFQSVNTAAVVLLAPVISVVWLLLDKRKVEPSIPRKFALGLIGNALGFAVLAYALTHLVDARNMIPFWPLAACYVLQTLGELCLSPIGLSMVTKLVPGSMVGFAMGGWFLSTSIGNNLSGLLAGHISGENGMTITSAVGGFSFSFWLLLGAGSALLLMAPLVNKLMHGIK